MEGEQAWTFSSHLSVSSIDTYPSSLETQFCGVFDLSIRSEVTS
jgi:hypothetical protein